MNLVIYILSYPLIWGLSILPMRFLYVISDLLYLLIYHVIGYRKNVVINNVKLAFPDKKDEEINDITKHFFKHFVDLLMESIKAFSISEKEIKKRYTLKNPEVLNKLITEEKSIALVGAHIANWEWFFSAPLYFKTNMYGTYSKLANPYFDKAIQKSRARFGGIVIKTSETIKTISNNHKNNTKGVYILLSDQSPTIQKTLYWRSFLGIDVPVHTGAESLAKKYQLTVVNFTTKKIKRGYYETEFTLISDTPKRAKDFQITDQYINITEEAIKTQPQHYLWSHNRFKHKDKHKEWLEIRK